MLRKVVFILRENILQEKVLRGESSLLGELKAHAVETVCTACQDNCEEAQAELNVDTPGQNALNCDVQHRDISDAAPANNEVLFITDSESTFHVLRQQGRYVLPYRYEENKDASFAGALYVIEQIEEIGYETVDMAYRRLAGLPWEIFTTKRCIIRESVVEDVDSFYQIYAEPEITKYMEDLYADRDEEIAYIRDYREKVYRFYGYGMWTVLTKEGTVIGRAGISWREGFELPELGFVIGVPWQRQGYAYEVCSAILDYAKEELGLVRIQALVMEGNNQSEALCRKLGFDCVGSVELEGKPHNVYRRG